MIFYSELIMFLCFHFFFFLSFFLFLTQTSPSISRKVCSSSEKEVFSEQLYSEPQFMYDDNCPFFHMFEGEKSVFGISFANERDASSFSKAVKTAASAISESATPAPVAKTLPPTPARPSTTSTTTSAISSHGSTNSSSQRPSYGSTTSTTSSTPKTVTKTVTSTSTSAKKKKKKSFFGGLLGKQSDADEPFTVSPLFSRYYIFTSPLFFRC